MIYHPNSLSANIEKLKAIVALDLLDATWIGYVEGVYSRLLFLLFAIVVPSPPVVTRDVGDDVDSVVDLARDTFAQLSFDIESLEDARLGGA